ncbi:hypothetical protein [Pseudofrankia sp. DC12]|uniref:restriction endonuclease subunit S n=1 Tax=Pseudofrankia sp. DC12 TaxID=683315 RepID=UPI0005F7C779|nr:hypothetical protein [Pseudofrankia sp. DC12]
MRTRLRHVAQVNPPSPRFDRLADDAEVTFLPMENVWPGARLDLSQVRQRSAVSTGYTRFQSGDVVVPKITPTFEASRSILIPDIPSQVGTGTTELHVVRPGPEVDARYLLYTFHSYDFLKFGAAEMYGVAGQKRVPDDLIRNWVVDLPSLDEQRRIADFLDAEIAQIDRLVQSRTRQSELLGELEIVLIDDAFAGLGAAPVTRLGYLAAVQTGVTVDSGRQIDGDTVTLPYLRVANVQVGYVDLEEVVEITVPRRTAATSLLRDGDVLMTEGGDLDKLGRGTVWRAQIPECLHQNHVFAVRPDLRVLYPDYLAVLTRASAARSYFESTGNKTTNLASTSSSKIRDFRIPLPGIPEQRKLVDDVVSKIEVVRHLDSRLSDQLGLLSERRQGLITAAVTGQIDPTTARGLGSTDGAAA